MSVRKTTCPYCGVGCGVKAEIQDDNIIAVCGDEEHPANAGKLCVKGSALAETASTEGRLLHPSLHGVQLDWNEALQLVADKLAITRAQYGSEAIAFYLSGQLLTEDYYVANKLMKGFLGSANVDTNSRLCMSSAVAAYKRAFGEDLVPCSYTDLETCDLLVIVGSNAAWTHPVLYQRIAAAKSNNPNKRIVTIDTRRTATSELADLHLQIKPGSDGFLFNGLLRELAQRGCIDKEFIATSTSGFDQALSAAADMLAEKVCVETGLSTEHLTQFYDWFCSTEQTVSFYSQGINQSATGTDKCNAIINCHLATGRIGKAGAGPFSITGQPNAMGGREVGGLANQMAAHMDFDTQSVDRVRRFWSATDIATEAGLKAVDMFQAAARGEIKFLWIMATNPAVSLPDSALVEAALQRCEFVVVSDCIADTDTARLADLLLPATGWGEKDGTVTNSERVISRQRALTSTTAEARPDWWIITEVARRMGFEDAFNYTCPADIFREHAALSAFENTGQRAFDIGALQQLSNQDYDDLQPQRWPLPAITQPPPPEPLSDGRYYTSNGLASFIPVDASRPAANERFTLNTGRLRDQWHTMTRTGLAPRLSRHRDFFSLNLHPQDASELKLSEGSFACIENKRGKLVARLECDNQLSPGQCFLPIHWSNSNTAAGRVSALIAPLTDKISGQPESKFSGVEISALMERSVAKIFSRQALDVTGVDYWSRIKVNNGYVTLVADRSLPQSIFSYLVQLCPDNLATASYEDAATDDYRFAACHETKPGFVVFLSSAASKLPPQEWLATLGDKSSSPAAVLTGIDLQQEQTGKMICSCWEVGEHTIAQAIRNGSNTVEQLGQQLRCGTQCGSCIPELQQMIARTENKLAS